MTYSEPVRNQKPNRLGTGNRTEPNRFLNYIPRNRTEPNREPEIHQFLETETEPNRTDPTLYYRDIHMELHGFMRNSCIYSSALMLKALKHCNPHKSVPMSPVDELSGQFCWRFLIQLDPQIKGLHGQS